MARGKFLVPTWYHSINNTKIVIYLDKINKTPLNIYRYINKTCLKLKKLKKNLICTLHITQTAGKTQHLEKRPLLFRA